MDILGRKLFGKTLFYPGCVLKHSAKNLLENYERILAQLGVSYVKLDGVERCCGLPALNAGYTDDFTAIVDSNTQVFKDQGVSRVITVCPECYFTFFNYYPKLKVEHVTQVIARNLDKVMPKAFAEEPEEITYYDPCYLGRKSGIYHEPREILQRLGYVVKELKDNRENAMCCGAGGGLKENSPKIANKIAQMLLSKVKTKRLVTVCPNCYLHLKKNAVDVQVLELSELMLE